MHYPFAQSYKASDRGHAPRRHGMPCEMDSMLASSGGFGIPRGAAWTLPGPHPDSGTSALEAPALAPETRPRVSARRGGFAGLALNHLPLQVKDNDGLAQGASKALARYGGVKALVCAEGRALSLLAENSHCSVSSNARATTSHALFFLRDFG